MVFKDPESKLLSAIEIKETCADCGKPVSAPSRPGSMTGWIFNSEYKAITERWTCTCNAKSVQTTGKASASAARNAKLSEPLPPANADNAAKLNFQAFEAKLKLEQKNQAQQEHKEQEFSPLSIDGKWRTTSIIGTGPLGCVYKGESTTDLQSVAIKILSPIVSKNPRIVKRFLQECEKASALHHGNMATVYDYGMLPDGSAYAVYELLENNLASELKKQGFIDSDDVLNMFIQICDALAMSHRADVVHRGIKPTNILLQSDKKPRLIDFGVAKALPSGGKEAQLLTATSYVFGDPLYMSPEQCHGERLDGRSDIYSIGCVMHEALTGKRPFHKKSGLQLAIAHLCEPPPPFSKIMFNCDISEDIESIVMTAIEKNPADRYQTIKELQADLILVRDGKRIKKSKRKRGDAATPPAVPKMQVSIPITIPEFDLSEILSRMPPSAVLLVLIPILLLAMVIIVVIVYQPYKLEDLHQKPIKVIHEFKRDSDGRLIEE